MSWDAPSDRHHLALEKLYERLPQAEEAVFFTVSSLEQALSAIH